VLPDGSGLGGLETEALVMTCSAYGMKTLAVDHPVIGWHSWVVNFWHASSIPYGMVSCLLHSDSSTPSADVRCGHSFGCATNHDSKPTAGSPLSFARAAAFDSQ
jgi:hypothetical protein